MAQVWKRLNRRNPDGISHIWKRDFINGWYAATMLSPDEKVPIAPIPELAITAPSKAQRPTAGGR